MRAKRHLRVQSLEQRRLLAVMVVDPQPGETPAAVFANALQQANNTPEPDTIELAPAVYDLGTIDQQSLEVTSELSIVGQSPADTTILPHGTATSIIVTGGGNLKLSGLTIYAPVARTSTALQVDGQAELFQVAMIGLSGSIEDPQGFSPPTSLIVNQGLVSIRDSILTDSPGTAIQNSGSLMMEGSIVSGSRVSGINSINGDATEIRDSLFFENGTGIVGRSTLQISGSTVAQNGQLIGVAGFPGGGIHWIGSEDVSEIQIDPDNVVVDNQIQFPEPKPLDIQVRWPSEIENYSLGTSSEAVSRLEERSIETVDGVLQSSDLSLEGVNVSVRQVDGQTLVESRGLGVSSVFWNGVEQRFMIESVRRRVDELFPISDELVDLDAGRVIGSGSAIEFSTRDLLGDREDLTVASQNTWRYLDVTNVTSTSGAEVSSWNHGGFLNWFRYRARPGFEGQDTLIVTGTDRNGVELEGIIIVDVASQSTVTLNVAASELNESIDVALSSSGMGRLSSFDFSVTFDPEVVDLDEVEFGRGYPFLQSINTDRPGKVNISALNGFSTGNDLVKLSFRRIAPGSAQIQLSRSGFIARSDGQDLSFDALPMKYYHLTQHDTNRDGSVTPSDALMVINGLARPSALETGGSEVSYDREMDTNGDALVTPSDALSVINRLGQEAAVGESLAEHPIFSSTASAFLAVGEDIPDFVARPHLPIDDGTPAEGVDLTPPTPQAISSAEQLVVGDSGRSLPGTLTGIHDSRLYAVPANGQRLGFGLTNDSGRHDALTLTIWSHDGSLIDAYPTKVSQGIAGGAVETSAGDQWVYFRIGLSTDVTTDFRFDLVTL
ncbi:hypothetical protein FYK55_14080 [Roseiconus nitratireducens]|uniref:Dockerin type I repeat protein n=1 Tax=Roseiconus nitratireducens TaxID=2605748 RepID=A0A5M6D565_9BACT|nr:dockerin type I domain-containing protein [Roseiconus nitratireducens]KAA5542657.1 hypothetical protein FYK55_14080 [Roseiconus nitratireducens]